MLQQSSSLITTFATTESQILLKLDSVHFKQGSVHIKMISIILGLQSPSVLVQLNCFHDYILLERAKLSQSSLKMSVFRPVFISFLF